MKILTKALTVNGHQMPVGTPVYMLQHLHFKMNLQVGSKGYLKQKPIEDRFWYRVRRGSPQDCWLWMGGNNGRYGILGRGPRGAGMVYAHRLSYELSNGSPPPKELDVLHRCDTPLCVNPSHLFVGSVHDNMMDMLAKGRESRKPRTPGTKNSHAKLSEGAVVELRGLHNQWRSLPTRKERGQFVRDLTTKYGLCKSSVIRIIAGRSWRTL